MKLLNPGQRALGHGVVDDESHVRLVDACRREKRKGGELEKGGELVKKGRGEAGARTHAERERGADDAHAAVQSVRYKKRNTLEKPRCGS